ncbi:MAG: endonuclease domain-containing protein [Alphaproteobacteria bacterium]|nr:MAG: endonuclease domain-containing protein [Alphaproteobacteria bacterium]
MAPSDFLFQGYHFDSAQSLLRLDYAFRDGPSFTETLQFPNARTEFEPHERQALDAAFRVILLMAGVSYYKAYAPARMLCPAFALDAETASWVTQVYRMGLGEFAYRNKLDMSQRAQCEAQTQNAPPPTRLHLPRRDCVAVGGGKDSIVTIEAARQAGQTPFLFAMGGVGGPARPIAQTIQVAGFPALHAVRRIDPALIELNKTGVLNGHVPVTAILSAILAAGAILYGYDAILLSNERSASVANLSLNGTEVNHQYSKSLEFERGFAQTLARLVSPDIAYFSLLRPLSEVAIARRFARHRAYHDIFTSCNKAFRQDESRRGRGWCGDCPKCRFVFLALAPFMAKDRLIDIFGRNLLDDSAQVSGFAELAGLENFKPFECVGEVEESAILLAKLAQDDSWKHDAVPSALAARLPQDSQDIDARYQAFFTPDMAHRVPNSYLGWLHEDP